MSVVKAILGPAYPFYIRIRTSEFVRDCHAAVGYPGYYFRRMQNPRTFAIDIDGKMGVGAVLAKALLFHDFADQCGLDPAIISSNPLYTPSSEVDFLSTYFIRPLLSPGVVPIRGSGYWWAFRNVAPQHMPLARAQSLFAIYFRPTDAVIRVIDGALRGRSEFDISVHYRSTDKVLEAPAVTYDRAFAAIDRLLGDNGGTADIFLATDDDQFEQAMRTRYDRCDITSYNLGTVKPGTPRHFSNLLPQEKAIEAIANIFLLSRARTCIRTSSYLSSFCPIANPSLSTITLNRTSGGSNLFPEAEVVAAEGAA